MQHAIAIRYGIIGGVGVLAYFLLFYWSNVRLFFNPVVVWSVLIVYVTAMVGACAKQRQQQVHFSFREALRTAFLTFAIASLCYHVFIYLMYNIIDPELVEVQKELFFEQMTAMAQRFNLKDLKDQITEFSANDFRVTVRNSTMALGQSLIGGFLLALGVAALMRRN